MHEPWGASLFHLEHYFSLIMTSSFVQLVLRIFWLLASFVEVSSPCYLFAIFDPQYSLISSKYSSLDTCIWFHSYYEKCTSWGETHTILAFFICHPFWHLLPMGEKFRGFKGNDFILKIGLFSSVCLSCISSLLCFAWLNILWGSLLYICWFHSHLLH